MQYAPSACGGAIYRWSALLRRLHTSRMSQLVIMTTTGFIKCILHVLWRLGGNKQKLPLVQP